MPKVFLLNPEEEPIKEKHISWNIERDDIQNQIILYEVVECLYDHPQAPGEALIPRIELKRVVSYKVTKLDAAPLLLLEHALNNVSMFTRMMDLVPKR